MYKKDLKILFLFIKSSLICRHLFPSGEWDFESDFKPSPLRASTFNRLHGGKKYYLSKPREYIQISGRMKKNFFPAMAFLQSAYIKCKY